MPDARDGRQRDAADQYCRPRALLSSGTDITLGARPEHIDVVGEDQADLVITLDLVEQLGGETYLYGSAPGLPQLTVRQDGQAAYDRNQRLGLRLKRDALHLFDCGRKRDPHSLILLRRNFR